MGAKRRVDYRRIGLLGLALFVAAFVFSFLVRESGKIEDEVEAANLANFQAGYIISDYQMTDYNSMSEADIQNFLTSKNSCGNRDYNYYRALSAGSAYTWHFENGHFICLSEERFGNSDNEIGFQYGETAAHIIWQAAQDYRINPKVLIVLLQKETGLITDPIPNNGDYRKATGYGCPDTAACSSKYYGFKNQVRNAAYLFRIVMDGNSSYYPIGNNYIQYNPNAGCGGGVVNVRNLATSALYRYTPYQPNAGALAAGYGEAPCGAYGNRNFFLYFEDWFGDINEEGVLEFPDSSFVIEGEYIIKSAIKNSMVIDVAGGSNANTANIQIYSDNGSGAQKWKITDAGDGSYIISNTANGKALDVEAGKIKDTTNVQQYSLNKSCAQKWHIVQNADRTYTIYSVCSGRVLDVAGGNAGDGVNIQIYRPNGSLAQKWKLVPVQTVLDGEYTIETVSSGLSAAVDITGGVDSAKEGTNIQIYERNNTEAQKWKVTYGSDGYYTILNLATNKVLDVVGASVVGGANVQLYTANGTCAQKWQIHTGNNGYRIISACSGLGLEVDAANIQISGDGVGEEWTFDLLSPIEDGIYEIQSVVGGGMVLDVAGGSELDTANIQIFKSNGSSAQQWQLVADTDNIYSVKSLVSGKALDVTNGKIFNGANVQQYSFNNSCAQKWRIVRNTDKTYSMYSACSNKTLDVAGGRVVNETNVQIYEANDSAAQKWKIIEK